MLDSPLSNQCSSFIPHECSKYPTRYMRGTTIGLPPTIILLSTFLPPRARPDTYQRWSQDLHHRAIVSDVKGDSQVVASGNNHRFRLDLSLSVSPERVAQGYSHTYPSFGPIRTSTILVGPSNKSIGKGKSQRGLRNALTLLRYSISLPPGLAPLTLAPDI